MKKMAIITLYDDINFGNKLQNYATQEYFKKRGFDVETIPYREERHPHRTIKYKIRRLIRSFLVLLRIKNPDRTDRRLDKCRRERIKSFSDYYIKLAQEVSCRNIPPDLQNRYDYFVTGSDQVWRVWNDDRNLISFFLLMFVPPRKRITMSPSFGLSTVEKKYYSLYREGLEGFSQISVREKEGKQIVAEICGRDATILLDPTMLVDETVWKDIQKKPIEFVNYEYILVYMLGSYSNHQKEIERLSESTGIAIVNLFDLPLYVNTRPDEFLYWINNAKLVVTDSFHAAVFSILFRKDFIVYTNNNPGMSNRLITLLETFGLQQRGYDDHQGIRPNDLFATNFSGVKSILCEERNKAKNFYDSYFDLNL